MTDAPSNPAPDLEVRADAPSLDLAELAAALYRLEWDADLYATPKGDVTERYERRADRLRRDHLARHDRRVKAEALAPVLDFINQRPGYVTAIKNTIETDADYYRWNGGAEARRQLANTLGLTVPYKPGERAEPIERGETDG